MKIIFPPRLKKGDEIRVIAPSSSLAAVRPSVRVLAKKHLEAMGFSVSFSKHAKEIDDFSSSSVKARLQDLHEAFADKKVKMILCARGGYNANQLLTGLDYALIKRNPKILCGYSDITVLSNALLAKIGLVSYSGSNFTGFAMEKGAEYMVEYFQKAVGQSESYEVLPVKYWSDDPWHKDQKKRNFHKNKGYLVVRKGKAEGTIIGGNLCTFNLLQGTEYMPSLKDTILFLEDDNLPGEHTLVEFDRNLQSLIYQPGFKGVRGMVIGRFQKKSQVKDRLLVEMLLAKPELKHIPIIVNTNFGHTDQQFMFPIGGRAGLEAKEKRINLSILKH